MTVRPTLICLLLDNNSRRLGVGMRCKMAAHCHTSYAAGDMYDTLVLHASLDTPDDLRQVIAHALA